MSSFLKRKFYIVSIMIFSIFPAFGEEEYDFELQSEEVPKSYSGPSKDSLGKKFHSPWEIDPSLFEIPKDATEINVSTERKWSRRYLVLPLMLSTFLGFGSGSEIQGDMSTFGPSMMIDLFGWCMVIPGAIFHTMHYDTYGWDHKLILEDLKKFFPREGGDSSSGGDENETPPSMSGGPRSLLRDPYGYKSYGISGILAGQEEAVDLPDDTVVDPDLEEEEEEEEEEYTVPDEFYDAVQYSVGTFFMILGSVSLIVSRIRQIAAVPIFYEKEISLRTLLEKKRREQSSIYYRSRDWNHYTKVQPLKALWKGLVFSNGITPAGSFSIRIGGIFSLRKG